MSTCDTRFLTYSESQSRIEHISTLWHNLNYSTTTASEFNSFKKLVKEQLKSLTVFPN